MQKYNVVSKRTRNNRITGKEIPVETFTGPYTVIGHDTNNFYVVHGNNGNYCPEDVEGCNEAVPQVAGFEKSLHRLEEY